ncbi:MAG: glycosyltransferase family 1 protein [Polyangiaceae bacterium]|nr:glycosyltransferase family 1 protein [Polyangiaceae bacterium]
MESPTFLRERRGSGARASTDVLCLSHLRWGFVYQRPNHLMSRCAREHRVFFVEEPIFDADAPRLEVFEAQPSLQVVVPHLPPGRSLGAVDVMLSELVDGLVARERMRSPLLWLYTPMAVPFAKELDRAAVVYDCMDELSLFHGAPPELVQRERDLFAMADVVFTGGHGLWEKKKEHHPNVHAFPSSVDAAHFGKARGTLEEPSDQRSVPHPRLGFFGVLDERFDIPLIRESARARPDWHFILVGPVVKIDPATLPALPNIHYLGPKSYDELPSYLAGWDVAIMPFARNESTRYISPTKTLEYLAAGKPVVSTSIRDVVRTFADKKLVRIADRADHFVAEITQALSQRGTPLEEAWRTAVDDLLSQTSWDRTWARMHALIERAISRRRTNREEAPCSII